MSSSSKAKASGGGGKKPVLPKGLPVRAGGSAGVLLAGVGLLGYAAYQSLFTVPGGHRSVVFSKVSGVKPHVYQEGTHLLLPGIERDVSFNIRLQPRIIASRTGSKDLQIVKLKLRLLHKPVISELPKMLQTLGTDYADRVLPSIANETMASVVAQFTAAELITRREQVSSVIKAKLTERAKAFNIILDDVSITDLTFAAEYAAAVEAKQVAQQEAARAKYLVEKAIQDKEETIVRAQGEAAAATMFNEQLANDKEGNFLALRRIEAAKEIARHLSMGANRVYLTTDTLLLNNVGTSSQKSLVDEVVQAVKGGRR